MRVDVERILALKAELQEINKATLTDIEFFEDGKKLNIKPEALEHWRFVGLNNTDFISMGAYKEGLA